ncbi:hypothetical protein [Xanthomonas sp. 1678]|uniref:hypothetical protein n=1 Tax=Xanthomonas sp. 1678 TaxID=3158788 RepID=UPI00286761EE|nr:hypothetical protein [Xanthomonas translucens]
MNRPTDQDLHIARASQAAIPSALIPISIFRPSARLSLGSVVLLGLALALLTSCASIQVPPSDLIAKEGAHATAIDKFGPLSIVRTATVLPGEKLAGGKFSVLDECHEGKVRVVVRLESGQEAYGDLVPPCAVVLRGIQYVIDGSAMHTIQLTLTVDLVGADRSLVARSSSLATARRASARYAFAVDRDGDLLSANVVSTTAHETFHVLQGLRGAPVNVQGDEELAYTIGACAQLDALGWVREVDLPSIAIPRGAEGVSDSVAASNVAGIAVKKKLEQFTQGGAVTGNSINGSAMRRFCRNVFR